MSVGGKIFAWRLPGAIDIVMLFLVSGNCFCLRRHPNCWAAYPVRRAFLSTSLPQRAQAVIDSIIFLLGLGFFIVIIWRLYMFGHSIQTSGEYTATIRIPHYPFVYGIAVAFIPVCLVFLQS